LIQEQQQEAQINQASAAEILTDLSNLSIFASAVNPDKAKNKVKDNLPSPETEVTPEFTDKKTILSNYPTIVTGLLTFLCIAIGLIPLYKSLHISSSASAPQGLQLIEAISKGDFNEVKKLIQQGANIDIQNNGETPLYKALAMRRTDIVILLLDQNAQIDTKNHNGSTPLYLAVMVFCGKDITSEGIAERKNH
jgi:ankyrin repeat protein